MRPRKLKRYPPYDPPEYVDWRLDPELLAAYRATIQVDPERKAVIDALARGALLELYAQLVRIRVHDLTLKRWVRQGVISKAWLGTGEEAVTVGNVLALDKGKDIVSPMIRNAGACLMMGMPEADLFRGYLATGDSPNGGRDLHLGDPSKGVYQPVSQMGTNVPVMAGVALAFRQRQEARVALTWVGDGASRTGACHEGANLAAVEGLPLVLVLQHNQVALGTPTETHSRGEMSAWPDVYGIPSWKADGNNVLDVHAATVLAVARCREGRGPAAVVASTFRMGGHATHDEREARETFPARLFEEWGRRDPVGLFEGYLMEEGVSPHELEEVEQTMTARIEDGADEALRSRAHLPEPQSALFPGITEGGVLLGLERRPSRSPIDVRA